MNPDNLPKIKLYAVTRQPQEDELTGYRISSCHNEFIKRMILKYRISSEYPQQYLVKIGMSVASKLVDLDGVPTHIFIQYFPETNGFHYFSYPTPRIALNGLKRFLKTLYISQ
jgi:hypothetical protein